MSNPPSPTVNDTALVRPAHDRLAEWLLFGQIVACTFLQKFAVPVGGGEQLFVGLFIMQGLMALGLLTRRLEVRSGNFVLYLVMVGGLTVTQLLGGRDFSLLSLLLLVTVHIPYVFGLRTGLARPGIELQFYQKVCAVLSVMAILQYPLQFVVGNHAFLLDTDFPKDFIMQGFHGMNPLGYGLSVYKSTAIVMLEPAILCQFLAIAIVIEMIYFRDWLRLCLYLAGIAVTFSGTGLIIVMLLAPVYLVQKRQFLPLVAVIVLAATAGLWMPAVGLEKTYLRAFEIMNPQTSGYARFISVFPSLRDFVLPEPETLLFGMGSGTMRTALVYVDYAIFNPSWGKILFEFGLLGAIAYFTFMARVFFSATRSAYLKLALFIQFMFLGEYILPSTVHCLIIALLAWPAADKLAQAGSRKNPARPTPERDTP